MPSWVARLLGYLECVKEHVKFYETAINSCLNLEVPVLYMFKIGLMENETQLTACSQRHCFARLRSAAAR